MMESFTHLVYIEVLNDGIECCVEIIQQINNLKQYNINWRDVQRKNVANNVDMSSLRAPWQKSPYKNQHTEQHKNTWNTKTQHTLRKINLFFWVCFWPTNKPGKVYLHWCAFCRQRRKAAYITEVDGDRFKCFRYHCLPAYELTSYLPEILIQ